MGEHFPMSCAPTISFSKVKAFREGSSMVFTCSNGSANNRRCRGERYFFQISSATSPESAICTASGNHCLFTPSGGAECQKLVFAQIDNAALESGNSDSTLLVNLIRSAKRPVLRQFPMHVIIAKATRNCLHRVIPTAFLLQRQPHQVADGTSNQHGEGAADNHPNDGTSSGSFGKPC